MTKKIPAIWITLKTAVKVNPYQDKFGSLSKWGEEIGEMYKAALSPPTFFCH